MLNIVTSLHTMMSRLRYFGLMVGVLGAFALNVTQVLAHESRPLYLNITEQSLGHYQAILKIPGGLEQSNHPDITYQGCQINRDKLSFTRESSVVYLQSMNCSGGLQALHLAYPRYQPSFSMLIRLKRNSGEVQTSLLNPGENDWLIPVKETSYSVFVNYTQMGVLHISKGLDHLLFLVCLIFIAGTGKRILITITGFTLAHSLTLTLASLQWVQLSVAPVEAVIALSVVFLAKEIASPRERSLTWRYPIVVSSSFGLLHGFGFASVLQEIGLPQTELLAGLVAFNLGVELGQLVFVGGVLGLYWVIRNTGGIGICQKLQRPVIYSVGIVASYWFIERSAGFMFLS